MRPDFPKLPLHLKPLTFGTHLLQCMFSNHNHTLQVQQALIHASLLDLGLPQMDTVWLWRAAAQEERHEAMFGCVDEAWP
jgi:hypothetical protein